MSRPPPTPPKNLKLKMTRGLALSTQSSPQLCIAPSVTSSQMRRLDGHGLSFTRSYICRCVFSRSMTTRASIQDRPQVPASPPRTLQTHINENGREGCETSLFFNFLSTGASYILLARQNSDWARTPRLSSHGSALRRSYSMSVPRGYYSLDRGMFVLLDEGLGLDVAVIYSESMSRD